MVDAKPGLPEALEAAVRFHGHLCPGLLIGYRAALLALDALGVGPSVDEDLILIAENDSCSVDAFRASAPGAIPPSREERIEILLSAPATDLFHLNSVSIRLPGRAEVRKSVPCARCREGVMETRTVASDDGFVCLPCARDLGVSG